MSGYDDWKLDSGRETAAWEREDDDSIEVCDYCSQPVVPDSDHTTCAISAQEDL